jgi:hypothetical protein
MKSPAKAAPALPFSFRRPDLMGRFVLSVLESYRAKARRSTEYSEHPPRTMSNCAPKQSHSASQSYPAERPLAWHFALGLCGWPRRALGRSAEKKANCSFTLGPMQLCRVERGQVCQKHRPPLRGGCMTRKLGSGLKVAY